MTREIRVQAQADHIASLANASPLSAIQELVWNALDADAREVSVDLVTNPLGGIDAIRVTDNGTGIDMDTIESTFGALGGSWKRESGAATANGRRLHGRHGRGRFKAFSLGGHVEWRTTSVTKDGTMSWRISGDTSTPGLFSAEQMPPGPACGTEVYITNIRANAVALADAGLAVPALAAAFALYLKAYPNVRVHYCGLPVTPVVVHRGSTIYNVRTELGGEAKLEVIEWRRRFIGSGRLVFCGGDGFALRDLPAGVRAADATSFTAYLVSQRFSELHAENALLMEELHPEVRAYLSSARKLLRMHMKVRAAEADRARVAAWIAEGSYPFSADDASPQRERFDSAVADMRATLDGFDAISADERRYLFGILLKSIGR